jgi:hypothetical protein
MFAGFSVIGVAIGSFMGVLAGIALLLLLSPAITVAPKPQVALQLRPVIAQSVGTMLGMPGIMFGGSWMANQILQPDENFADCYALSLTLFFLFTIVFPVSRWILKFGRTVGD